MHEMNRRQFVAATCSASACLLCSFNSLAAPPPGEQVDVGPLASFTAEGITDTFAANKGFFLIRLKGQLFAASAVCTHKAFPVEKEGNGKTLECTRHGSLFDARGVVTKGPARNSLPRFAIRLNEQGRVVVDTTRRFEQKQWTDPASFLKV